MVLLPEVTEVNVTVATPPAAVTGAVLDRVPEPAKTENVMPLVASVLRFPNWSSILAVTVLPDPPAVIEAGEPDRVSFVAGPGLPVTVNKALTLPAAILMRFVPAIVPRVTVAVARPLASEVALAGETEPFPASTLKFTGKLDRRLPFFFRSSTWRAT